MAVTFRHGRVVRAALACAAVVATLVAIPASQASTGSCPPSRCVTYRLPVPAGVRVSDNQVRVILPVGYAKTKKRYPVIYLFNGIIGPYDEWVRGSDIGSYSAQFPAIFVDMASGNPPIAGYFSDWQDGSYQWEKWHVHTVMPWIDAHLRTIRGDNAAVAVSEGATGALNYAEHNPGLFRVVASFSGLVDTQWASPVSGYEMTQADPVIKRVWGDQILNADVWAKHNPTVGVAALRGTKLYLACGTGSPSSSTDIHGGQEEENLFGDHSTFLAALAAAGIPHTDHFYLGGEHGWPYFVQDLHWALPLLIHDLA